ncbi:hypothetical protein COCSADRAFT_353127 [Bipolaris sorokiniana ND90Pr]|uniref:Uncharacterized protein n=1 Tax=Cochliobolus sativus (strain ND90Pr / ATCC 201652) TaxID=665912 RepID=M2SV00_COCSN|nr:uncharacterized protein COCSADRAFT_353127 [Bipolaris sorokiniana ND90Pr]EMD66090.1 hypothetical protein COCSADRAFT_353127 [Bipolaris sorokiniana ND90Pr]
MGGLAFLALQAYVQDFISRNVLPSLSKFLLHVRAFNLKFNEAGFGQDDNALKINYLKNSLNRKLLRYQARYQPPLNETYDAFVHRLRNT